MAQFTELDFVKNVALVATLRESDEEQIIGVGRYYAIDDPSGAVSDIDAGEMIAKLRSSKLLEGYRGSPPGDREALVQVIQRVSALVELVPELRELDLNPVKVLEPGQGAIVVDGRLRIGPI